jgi:hypothetical protein
MRVKEGRQVAKTIDEIADGNREALNIRDAKARDFNASQMMAHEGGYS